MKRSYTSDEARKIVMQCAKKYEQNLLNKRYLIIYRDKTENIIKDIEIEFNEENYQHLTGLELIDKNGKVRQHVSKLFFEKCLKNKLGKKEFQFKSDGTTNLKLRALPTMMEIHKVTKIAGDYNNSRPYLIADTLIGNINFCLGLKQVTEKDYYVPVSTLLENIKNITITQSQVLAIFSKKKYDDIYKEVRHVAKGINLHNLNFPQCISQKISLENYISKNLNNIQL